MKHQFFSSAVIITLLLTVALSLAAEPDPVHLGSFIEPFTTLFAAGELVDPGELDWYVFEVDADDSTIFILADGESDTYGVRVVLFDEQDAYIAAAEGRLLEARLTKGTYRIRIGSVGIEAQNYSLIVFNGVESESNEGLLEANDLGEIGGPAWSVASLLPPGDADFFSFQVPENGLPEPNNAFLIETSGRDSGDSVTILYQYSDREGRYLPIAFDDDSGSGYWSSLLVLPGPGDRYAIRVEENVYLLSGVDGYALSITPIFLGVDEEPNNISAQAMILDPVSPEAGVWEANGMLDVGDRIDFYKLIIDTTVLVQINAESQIEAYPCDTLLTVYLPTGDRLAESDTTGDSTWSRLTVALDPGEYLIAVEGGDRETEPTPYRLQVAAQLVTAVVETEPNDTDETAETIEWAGGEALMVEAAIGTAGDVDSFRFVLQEEATLVLETGPRHGSRSVSDTTLAVYDEDLWEIAFNDDANGAWSRIEVTLTAGTYYAVVKGYYDDEVFDYILLMSPLDN